ncbi:MAG: hypothetical protein HY420_01585 [Candidatus Kerfeldbacteria bacterium]|nr:hypothetical protein [Candidatus Kerfeldbacteria bacterium]
MSAKSILYGWAPGARTFAESVRCLPEITDVQVGPIVTDGYQPCGTVICVPGRRDLRVTIRYPADGADQIIFARRRINADPVTLAATITRLWEGHRSASLYGSVVFSPRKEIAMPLTTREDVHPDTIRAAMLFERLSSVRSVSVGARKRRYGKDRLTEPLPVKPDSEAKKVLVISSTGDGFYDEIFLFPRNGSMTGVVYHDALAAVKDLGRGPPPTGTALFNRQPAVSDRRSGHHETATHVTEEEALCEKIDALRCVESASLGPAEPRSHPGPPPPPSIKKLDRGDTIITVMVFSETHYRKIHVRPLVADEIQVVHGLVEQKLPKIEKEPDAIPRRTVSANADGATKPDATLDGSMKVVPTGRKEPMPRGQKSPKKSELSPREAEVYAFLKGEQKGGPDHELLAKAQKKFGKSVVNQWYALRQKGLIEKTADGYLVHKAKVAIKQRGDAGAKKLAKKRPVAAKAARTPKTTVGSSDPLHAAVTFFTKHPELLEGKLFEEAGRHLSYLDKHGWKLELQEGKIHLVPAS